MTPLDDNVIASMAFTCWVEAYPMHQWLQNRAFTSFLSGGDAVPGSPTSESILQDCRKFCRYTACTDAGSHYTTLCRLR